MLANLDQDEMAKVLKEFPAKVLEVHSIVVNTLNHLHTSLSIPVGDGSNRVVEDFPINEPQDFNDILIPDLPASVRNNLVKKALGIPQTSFRFLSD
jgi:hypothetical protein